MRQEAYILHKPVIRKFKRRRTICVGVDHLWQIDLADMISLSSYHDEFNRNLNTRMWSYFTYSSSLRYVDILPLIVKSYNDADHSSIEISRSRVAIHNESKLRKRAVVSKGQVKFSVGELVNKYTNLQ